MSQNRLSKKLAARGDKKFFCPYISCGFPTKGASVPMLLALQQGGADVIELGVPFSEPQADGPVIQASNHMALCAGATMQSVLDTVKEARGEGLEVPVVLMGYLNPILQYREPLKDGETSSAKRRPPSSLDTYVKAAKDSGADAFIIVDMPPDDPSSKELLDACRAHDMCYIPLLSPTTTPERLGELCEHATGFVYAVSQLGVTGRDLTRSFNPEEAKSAAPVAERSVEEAALDSGLRQPLDLPTFIERIRKATKLPIAVGFGIKSKKDFDKVTELSDMGVVGSECIRVVLKHLEEDDKGRPKLLTPDQEKELVPKIVASLESYTREMTATA